MEILFVGDPHIQVQDLDQGRALIDLIRTRGAPAKILCFLGDLFHNHSLVNLEVLAFWRAALHGLKGLFQDIWILVGNHDAPHDMPPGVHALQEFAGMDGITVVDEPRTWGPVFSLMPHFRDAKAFVSAAQKLGGRNLICHQTFDGSKYENGFFASDGVDSDALPQERVISGHIHQGQEFGRVWYPGAPRALTAGDANQERVLWETTWSPEALLTRTPVATEGILFRQLAVEDNEATPLEPSGLKIYPGDRVTVTIVGTQERVQARRLLWAGSARIRAVYTDAGPKSTVRQSEGIMPALQRYLPTFRTKNGTRADILFGEISKRLGIIAQ